VKKRIKAIKRRKSVRSISSARASFPRRPGPISITVVECTSAPEVSVTVMG